MFAKENLAAEIKRKQIKEKDAEKWDEGKRGLLWVTVGCELDLVWDTSRIEQTDTTLDLNRKQAWL
jgi:hypothetical protein